MADTLVKIMECAVADKGLLKVERIGVGVGIILYNAIQKVGAGIHVLAPTSPTPDPDNPAKYADTAIPHALKQLEKKGTKPPFAVTMTGGATMNGMPPAASMGPKVVAEAKNALKKAGLQVKDDQTGGSKIRTVTLDFETGLVKVVISPSE